MRAAGIKPAALLVDTIFSSDGVFSDPPGFLAAAVEAIRAEGGLFIADEVQPGFGRTGEAMWGFMRHGVTPDLVTMGKPMGNGYAGRRHGRPAGVAGRVRRPARYFNTFGGNPVAAPPRCAVLEVIERRGADGERAGRSASTVQTGCARWRNGYEAIGDVRGAGLFIGVELVRDRATKEPDAELTTFLVNGLRRRSPDRRRRAARQLPEGAAAAGVQP